MNQYGPLPDISGIDRYFNNIPDAYFLMKILLDENGDPYDFVYLYTNEAIHSISTLYKEDFIGRRFSEIFGVMPPKKWLKPYYSSAFHGTRDSWKDYSDEIQEYVEITCFPFEEGCAACFVKKITDKTLYERTIISSRLSYREIYFIDLRRDHYQMIFPSGEGSEKGSYSEAINQHFLSGQIAATNDVDEVKASLSLDNIRKSLKDKDYIEFKYQRRSPEGKSEWCLTGISVCERADGEAATVSMAIRSIEDLIAADERQQKVLTAALEEARRANSAKSDFLSSMSHDMRTPLNVITGMATLARIHNDDHSVVNDCLDKIDVSSKHLLSLVNGVLDMAKIENGDIELDDSAFSLSDMMEDIVLMTQSMISSKHQVLNFSLKNPEHENVIGDDNRLTQALLNILTNAIKYTDRHGRIQVEISERAFEDHTATYRFIIRDNGCGMSEEFLSHAFEAFTREVDIRLNKVAGTGLGLAITKKIIDKMGGVIHVNSTVGVGTEFIVDVPLLVQKDGQSEMTFPDERVLIVDDYIPCIDSICSVVEALESNHMAVSTGAEALSLLEETQNSTNPFTVAIIDYIMPDMDGITLTKEIRKRFGKSLPIIMISAYDYSMVKKEASKAGIDFFCTKPIFRSKLLRIFPYLRNQDEINEDYKALERRKHKKLKALLAEDNLLNAAIAKNLLEYLGLEVETAEDGKDALDTFRHSAPYEYDCIFMDVQMPVMNGLAAAKAIRVLDREDANIPIFAMTANVFTEDVRQTREAGMQEHIGKPINISQLQHVLERYFPDYDIIPENPHI
ncbi:MAG: response regulator [Lachnospiraceae bacterium]|nr:response regulator [Lachnospiraceae bacterium]